MIDDYVTKGEQVIVNEATLREVSLVTDPAIDSARVAEVAASETPENSEATAEETTTQEDKVSEINKTSQRLIKRK